MVMHEASRAVVASKVAKAVRRVKEPRVEFIELPLPE
jgi:hypothetical protein